MPFTEEQGKISKALKVAEGSCKMRYKTSRKAIVLKHKKNRCGESVLIFNEIKVSE